LTARKDKKPYSEIWTRFCENLIPLADALTVSNVALQQRYGGLIVRHARDEKVFDPTLYDRTAIRAEFGYGDRDKVVLFLGTPRPHKGIFRIAEALEKINDPRLALCIIGTINDKRVSDRFAAYKKARIDFHKNQPWERLPELVSMADLICILQDPNSPISEYQIPAKLTDAIAMNVPVLITDVPPLADIIAAKCTVAVDDDRLESEAWSNENSSSAANGNLGLSALITLPALAQNNRLEDTFNGTPLYTAQGVPSTPSEDGQTPTSSPEAAPATKNLVEQAASSNQFQTLAKVVKAAGLEEALAAEGPTLFLLPLMKPLLHCQKGQLEQLLLPENNKSWYNCRATM
jgi:hypothetical protein